MSNLAEWSNFYVIAGSAAGALIGLQFVVLTLVANNPPPGAADAGTVFATPTIVHFGVVLLLAAVLCAPWHEIAAVPVAWGFVGFSGIVYSVATARRMKVQTAYKPVFEDSLFHVLLPCAAYGMLGLSAGLAQFHSRPALFVAAAATLLLLFIGIHNAWDGVTYHVLSRVDEQPEDDRN